ncbi:hypothetical protein Phi4:1_gp129 [Cellulophaga phage phi4:1]|uniref:Uncharacterized protein n=5 Tax=Lightbulbvirus TaxID=1918522 RepID=A0A0S2MWN7_9CAUD|nr:hypothetical protein Phi4:1_gp129 [Cellulophaga phage phi4:1]YP_008241628.1 hypothetical protein Phi17:2_gp133 [Cellulophaga phage phi17:2]ALO80138.1 hypothetical protein Phi4113_129 [Cellulophaga phage phi4:1_13]ALO80335.1 hypothetical protein Phi4118_129 [Cellulophaga phage phi4:1_18]ALO80536.1 hypothetical protein Phi17218_133 [Cellulophaga phage phi17:2_18]AGO47666.1 hypothetical protein Phi17:2_gp133 [Cellulophaga phage phi17:2]AGO49542.1 hypothetical protein Phi4:1_gp129 [Cellulophag
MVKLNYNKLIALKPTVLTTIKNQIGQTIEIVEHPTKGDSSPTIAIFHEEKEAVLTDFFDTEDLYEGSDYNPVYMNGKINLAYELGL